MHISAEFLLTSLVVVLIPGTGVIYTVSNGLFLGWRASIGAAIGCTAGIIPHLTASIFGLSAILHMSALAFQLIKFAGAAYLLYLAWMMWRETGSLAFNSYESSAGLWRIIKRGFLINILNPKLSIFFLAFLPLFVSPEAASPTLQMIILSVLFMLMTLVIFILYGISANGVRSYVVNSPRIVTGLQRTFALTFAALGFKLALTDR
ncbi:LysE family translocator [Desulfopila sp. IMCC35008]|uniref:LysE family translocator n=1 Tax=Desulfopila sp. IMCC35008 TaxID=2653858 RepID=UPI0013D3EF8E|nr:LysE family translocator [Desulfopila sp. IMCC35008]